MEIKSWRDSPVISNPHNLDIRQLYNDPKVQLRIIVLQPGQRVKPFVSPITALLFVISGSVIVQSGDIIKPVEQNNLVACPPDKATSLFNNSDFEARVIALRAPRPTTKSLLL